MFHSKGTTANLYFIGLEEGVGLLAAGRRGNRNAIYAMVLISNWLKQRPKFTKPPLCINCPNEIPNEPAAFVCPIPTDDETHQVMLAVVCDACQFKRDEAIAAYIKLSGAKVVHHEGGNA